MKTDSQDLRNANFNEKGTVDLIRTPEAHGIELHVEELEQVIAPSKFKF